MFTPIPEEWTELRPRALEAVETQTSVFRPASSYPHFSLGFPPLDSLLRPFPFRFTTMISGQAASAVAELAAFRAQLPVEMGGLDSAVVFIDGGNRSDPYLFSSFARQYGYKPNAAMRRIATCRVFTMYQLADLISEHLAKVVADYAAKLVVVSDLLGTFNEPELEEMEARRLLNSIEQTIILTKKNTMVLVTLMSPSKYDNMALSWADTAINLVQTGDRMCAQLLKHPSKPPTTSTFRLNQLLVPTKAIR
jgi:hypothetical protein